MRRLLLGTATAATGIAVYAAVGRAGHLRWGATAAEVDSALPGDELLPHADLVATRAVSIDAPPERVWPWVAQMGQGRGGLYSYDWLENLAGCDITSADVVVEAWQDIAVGDAFRLHPDVALQVVRVDVPHALVVQGADASGEADPASGASAPYDFTWAFVLIDAGDAGTRFVVRERYRYLARWTPLMVEPLSIVSFVMTQKMLRGIRQRAQR
jgi:hypothetical protein